MMDAKNLNTVELSTPLVDGYAAAEAYKTLRTNLMFCGADKKTVLFTSCQPNEGKSTLVMNLAISLVEVGKRVLFIDADMRKSVLASKWVADPSAVKVGLSQYLSEQAELDAAVFATQYPGLHVMFSGYFPPNPVELLDNECFSTLIAKMREEYDYVLIDCAPIGAVIDAAVVARSADGIVMVVAVGKNSRHLALDCKKQLAKTGKPILGAIMNHTQASARMYYGKKYKYYSTYSSYQRYKPYGKEKK